MSDKNETLDKALDSLLAGNLSSKEAETLRQELADNSHRTKNSIDAWQIQAGLELPETVSAPESLRRKLRAIPVQNNEAENSLLHWGALASITIILATLLLINTQPVSEDPTQAEVDQARTELLVAFNYLNQVGQQANDHMKREIGGAMQDALVKGIFYGVTKEPENS